VSVAPPVTGAPLVIGYGNPLRGDDGLGWHAAAALAADPRMGDACVLQCHQLTPELAVDVLEASIVIFVDAREVCAAADLGVQVHQVSPRHGPGAWTHHTTPEALLDIARELGGRSTPALVVTAPAWSVDTSDELSPRAEAQLTHLVEQIAHLVSPDLAARGCI
jgi:hydrogenase maturation protease